MAVVAAAAAAVMVEGEGGMQPVLPMSQDLTSLTNLSRREISILQCTENESLKTRLNYFQIGLTLGLTYDMLLRNEKQPWLEMLLAARVNNFKTLLSEEFLLKIIGKAVITHVEGMLKYKEFIQEY